MKGGRHWTDRGRARARTRRADDRADTRMQRSGMRNTTLECETDQSYSPL
jgi:hypothetical protein